MLDGPVAVLLASVFDWGRMSYTRCSATHMLPWSHRSVRAGPQASQARTMAQDCL